MSLTAKIMDDLREAAAGKVESELMLSSYTTYKIGGPAEVFIAPETEEAVGKVLAIIARENIPMFVLGRGSNVLISDDGWPGVVLYLGENLTGVNWEGKRAKVLAGTHLAQLILEAVERGMGGMEQLAGIPGSVGGGLRMNAGAFGQEIESSLVCVYGYRSDGEEVVVTREQIDFGYRSAPQLGSVIITSAEFEFVEDDPEKLITRMNDILTVRARKQPLDYPSCGSVFKRPPGYYAGALIEEVGLKGHRVGNAMISEKHAGFILNLGDARAMDVFTLIREVEEAVKDKFGVSLEREVKLIGFPGELV